jgi:hypothetical protein
MHGVDVSMSVYVLDCTELDKKKSRQIMRFLRLAMTKGPTI